ncbi:hypothetical protein QJS04_geneDACA010530 [Acorus gramineus]|uniref:PWWP domain-containing protein n=1 Tax=Acorus gramineus TaxID=55184 RepID=A0AAV9AMI8_ACOGR|nr:hypothetical protein QJS04_geneDACA010530 [Acorus gramineus]
MSDNNPSSSPPLPSSVPAPAAADDELDLNASASESSVVVRPSDAGVVAPLEQPARASSAADGVPKSDLATEETTVLVEARQEEMKDEVVLVTAAADDAVNVGGESHGSGDEAVDSVVDAVGTAPVQIEVSTVVEGEPEEANVGSADVAEDLVLPTTAGDAGGGSTLDEKVEVAEELLSADELDDGEGQEVGETVEVVEQKPAVRKRGRPPKARKIAKEVKKSEELFSADESGDGEEKKPSARKRGRPPKSRKNDKAEKKGEEVVEELFSADESGDGKGQEVGESVTVEGKPAARKRGRPRKPTKIAKVEKKSEGDESDDEEGQEAGETATVVEEKPSARKRGRPPKSRKNDKAEKKNEEVAGDLFSSDEPDDGEGQEGGETITVEEKKSTARKRGRPPKSRKNDKAEKKNEEVGEDLFSSDEPDDGEGQEVGETITVEEKKSTARKRGRPPKSRKNDKAEKKNEEVGEDLFSSDEPDDGEGQEVGETITVEEKKSTARKRGRPPKSKDSEAEKKSEEVVKELFSDEESDDGEGQEGGEKELAARKSGCPPNSRNITKAEKTSEEEFGVSDMVWGKIKSHPWWPGQIFDPSDASEMAEKHQKKGCLLVAYFGDHTFAWCEPSKLKPFEAHFPNMAKESSMDAFVSAVDEALDEVSRRVVLGLTCNCVPEESYADLKNEVIENAGIRERATNTDWLNMSSFARSFEPNMFLEYIKSLAESPMAKTDGLQFVTAQAQLAAIHLKKGYQELPAFYHGGGFAECDDDGKPESDVMQVNRDTSLTDRKRVSVKGKARKEERMSRTPGDGLDNSKKERSLSELMKAKKSSRHLSNGRKVPSSSSGKQKSEALDDFDSLEVVRKRKKKLDSSGDLETKSPRMGTPKSFKIGECIRRVASQLTGSSPAVKDNSGTSRKALSSSRVSFRSDAETEILKYYSTCSMDEMLSQLCLAARDPLKGYSFLSMIVCFFADFRDLHTDGSVSLEENNGGQTGGMSSSKAKMGSLMSSESDDEDDDDVEDSYWTERVVQGSSPKRKKRKGDAKMQSPSKKVIPTEVELSDSVPAPSSRPAADPLEEPQVIDAGGDVRNGSMVEEQLDSYDKSAKEYNPAELILRFAESDALPSEVDLINIFSRYGPLKESETEVLKKSNHAKVVFKRGPDAELAFSSAGKFSIFGPALVSYQLKHISSVPKHSASQAKQDATFTEENKSGQDNAED